MATPREASSPRQSLQGSDDDDANAVPRNEHGGVLISREQIRAAFEFLDVERRGRVSMENLKARLGIFYPEMTTRDYRALLNNAAELSEEELAELLLRNDIADYDPVADAFRAYDPDGTGHGARLGDAHTTFVSFAVLTNVFERLGYGSLSDDDLKVLVATADADKDGRLNLEDFRSMLAM
ncbi:hypothetical protein ACHHYP_00265 [Achlya hypogyna]|uniref:EF-hand domain-containing protein n=1 Tax=Achlya hypogyna TaxID=1202772 RepID=A0A1V9ZUW7_ACHHY|nr:hypothetical protein ACHHYP_00265 [Achlya hypogyna]